MNCDTKLIAFAELPLTPSKACGGVRKSLPSLSIHSSMKKVGTPIEEGDEMSIAYRKVKICAFLCFMTIMGCIQTTEAKTVTLDCVTNSPFSINRQPVHGWRVIVNYSTSKVEWFSFLLENGSTFSLVFDAPAMINNTTISWQVPYQGDPTMTDSINRSTGVLYFDSRDVRGTGLCNISQAPPPKF